MMQGSSSKILIVDDNTLYLSLLKVILKEVDAHVYIASSGKDALSLINENDFALAVLDIEMPEMDGFELAAHIRNLKGRDLIPIIFLTAYFSDELQMFKGYDNGAIDYLTKPVNKTIFLSKVKIYLELDKQKRNLIDSKSSLEESRKKYIKLYDFAPTAYFTINREGEIFEINLKGAKLLGHKAKKLIGLKFNSFIAPEMQLELSGFLAKVFEGKSNTGCELKLINALGEPIFVYLDGALIDDDQKCLLSMIDISDRKEAQNALIESEELYHSLLRTSPDGIIITNLQGKIAEVSDIAIELLGCKNRSEIEGRHFMDFIPQSSRRTLVKLFRTTQEEGLVQNLEIKLKRKDDTEFSGELSSSLIKDNKGELKAFMAVIRDISERKLFEKQLRHSERMAGIGELATGMAHEINQPLNTISLAIDNIIYSLDNHSLTETYLKAKTNKVFDNITRIKKIIEHVRIFSRDQEDFVQSTFEINKSIQNSISMISEQMAHRDISLSFSQGSDLPTLIGNTYRFEQVILNLLINAKDAIEEKKKKSCKNYKMKIDVSTKLVGNQIFVEVKDNGIGIKSEDIDKVLLPFFTTKAPGQGTGLGLSISYGIIKELDGEIDIQSKPQVGTTIVMKIPAPENRSKNKS